ncbi:MAG: long-chain fatty acid--CoA ligase [Deltaproteobacteria bacterium]|nr:long-chain fatty acid--CoA ligase [Deltaproteobacteria bacterium]
MPHNLDQFPNLAAAFLAMAKSHPLKPVYKYGKISDSDYHSGKDAHLIERSWVAVTYSEVQARVEQLSRYLASCGVKRGDRVAIISNSRGEWLEADMAILLLGGIVVSVYQSLPAHDVGYILFDAQCRVVLAENSEQLEKIEHLRENPCAIPATEERPASSEQLSFDKVIVFEETPKREGVISLKDALREGENLPAAEAADTSREDLASLVYTSGTTGPPKGVMQTHGNHLSNVRQAYQAGLYDDSTSLMLVLPLAHSFAKLMGYIGFLTGATLRFPAVASRSSSRLAPLSVSRDLHECGAQLFPLVPRLLEKMKEGIQQRALGSGLEALLLRAALKSAEAVYHARQEKRKVPILSGLIFRLTGFLRDKIKRKIFGPEFRYIVSGGAKLPETVAVFFDSLGIEILEGYGLTETCVATNVNRLRNKKIGTVGPLLASDIELKLASDGEILFRGPNIAKGYYNRPSATAAAWDADGWFHTGDLGQIDRDGFLSITGRKKEIIVTAGGKKIAPEAIEQRFKAISFISQIVLIGEARPYCVAVITLNKEGAAVAGSVSDPDALIERLRSESQLARAIWAEFEKVNADLASFETVKKVLIVKDEFTVENGFLTPTFKIKRAVVQKRFEDALENLYLTKFEKQVFVEE